ncbi:MAG: YdcH family protein [Gammaproteobacteria bacterium]|nr:YdcH family protein [Gammaproteobacteria bacterium]MBU1416587.1 YdcH family protein [Gammaproteobacteria bacterium]
MPTSANDEPQNLIAQLQELRLEHRDLDAAINRLEAEPTLDDLLLRRMKKRKLHLKDRISVIERLLEPNELA